MLKARQLDSSLGYAEKKLQSYVDASASPKLVGSLHGGADTENAVNMDFGEMLESCSSLKLNSKT